MPELPEVETVKRTLEPHLADRIITRTHIGDYQRCIATPEPAQFCVRMNGRRIPGLGRRGKFVLIHLDSGDIVTVHLRMTGELSLATPEVPKGPHIHLWFDLDNGEQLRYHDVRKFGRWSLLTPEQFALFDASIGPEPLEDEFDAETFTRMLHSRKRILKPLLLDQAFLAGIGNIYADEALFRAGIHPNRRSHELSDAETERLYTSIREILLGALQHRGTTLRDYRDANGEPGENLSRLQIYSRSDGDPCPVCSTPVVRVVVGQRGTKFCPSCQPLLPGTD
jgi:formamidopyrimidine-DNA glycosylase